MHGRLKVRTTQEQEERKRLEREKKLKMYKSAMGECISRIEKRIRSSGPKNKRRNFVVKRRRSNFMEFSQEYTRTLAKNIV